MISGERERYIYIKNLLWGWGGGCEKQEGEKVERQKKKQERLRSN